MSIIFCNLCDHPIDPQEEEFHTHEDSLKSYCEDCYKDSPIYCEYMFNLENECICGNHMVMRAEPDVGVMHKYLVIK